MRPPTPVTRRVRIALFIGVGVVDSMGCGPLYRAAFKRQRATKDQEVLHYLGNFVAAVSHQTMVAHADAATADPVKYCRCDNRGPAPEKKSHDGCCVKNNQEGQGGPVDVSLSFAGCRFRPHSVAHFDSPKPNRRYSLFPARGLKLCDAVVPKLYSRLCAVTVQQSQFKGSFAPLSTRHQLRTKR